MDPEPSVPILDPPPEADDDERMPRWIPRVLLPAVLTYFLALLALAAFRQLRNIILWLIAALFLSFVSSRR